MSIIESKKLKTRILLGYSVPIGVLTIFALVTGVAILQLQDVAHDLEVSNNVLDAARDTVIYTGEMVGSARGAVISPQNPQYIEEFKAASNNLKKAIGSIKEGDIQDVEQQEVWAELLRLEEDIVVNLEKVMASIKAGQVNAAKAVIVTVEMDDFLVAKLNMIKETNSNILDLQNRERFVINATFAIIIIGLFGGGAVSLVLGNMIASKITNDVKKAIVDVTASSNEIAATMEEQERTANLQAASVSETTTTMDELGASSRQSEEQAESASQAAQEVLQLADNGNQSVEETVSTMVDLKNKVAAIADQIVRLSEQTNQIGNISSVVSDLSQQTNMLALNASVEAVRAGEHGKGFAVVAEEIRKLADQSRQSASNIGSLVSDIQNAINTTVMVTDEGTKTVNAGLLVTERTANAFSGVLESVNNVAMNNQQIVLNIRQQGKAVQQVLQAMDSINQGAQQTAASLSQIKAGTATLAHTARDLEAIV
jgi:methyl-accepting chemotaxis protein